MEQSMLVDQQAVPLGRVINSLEHLRINVVEEEYQLQDAVAEVLKNANIPFQKEYKLAPRKRIDFLIGGGIGIEIKKGKPYGANLLLQLKRYASCSVISALVVVVERKAEVPKVINGKPCYCLQLNKLWGIAL